MNKTLLKHFTIKNSSHHELPTALDMQTESLSDLVSEMKQTLEQAESELLSPRPQAIEQLLNKALN